MLGKVLYVDTNDTNIIRRYGYMQRHHFLTFVHDPDIGTSFAFMIFE